MEKFSSLMFIIKPYSHYHRYFDISLICKVIEKLLKNFKIFILLILFYSELRTHTKTLSARLLSLLYMYESSKKKTQISHPIQQSKTCSIYIELILSQNVHYATFLCIKVMGSFLRCANILYLISHFLKMKVQMNYFEREMKVYMTYF